MDFANQAPWEFRRKIAVGTLIYCGVVVTSVFVAGFAGFPVPEVLSRIVDSAFWLMGGVVGAYTIGKAFGR